LFTYKNKTKQSDCLVGILASIELPKTKENLKVIAELYRIEAEQGNVQAQGMLGVLYQIGEGVPKDENESQKWLKRAADNGDESAKAMLKQKQVEALVPIDHLAAMQQYKEFRKFPQQHNGEIVEWMLEVMGGSYGVVDACIASKRSEYLSAGSHGVFLNYDVDLMGKLDVLKKDVIVVKGKFVGLSNEGHVLLRVSEYRKIDVAL